MPVETVVPLCPGVNAPTHVGKPFGCGLFPYTILCNVSKQPLHAQSFEAPVYFAASVEQFEIGEQK